MMQPRLATFVAKLSEREVDAILVSGTENRRYLMPRVRTRWT